MPGIVGLITRMPRAEAEECLVKMVAALRHESFYVSDTWVDEQLGVYAGWVARRGSFSDCMPVCNETANRWLLFSGEEYPEPGTIADLKQRGHDVDSKGPGYLVHLSEEDPSFPARLNGRFHGVVADRAQHTVTLFNDRYGMHRVYYHESSEAFYFAAEAKAILAVRPELRRMDRQGMGEFIACGCILENRTLFENIHVLPPASAWTFSHGAVHKHAYFQPAEWESLPPLDPQAYYEELQRVFRSAVPRYFNGRERIGMSLTGGLDTRMIVAAHKPAPSTLPCYSFGSMFRDCQDVVIARRVAQACGQTHQVIPVANDFLSRFPHYAERSVYLTDGCTDVSHAVDLYVNERASAIAPVRMTGNYGGEVLRRVRAFKPSEFPTNPFTVDMASVLSAAKQTYARTIDVHPLSFAVFRQAPWHHYGLLSLEQTQISLRSPFLDNNLVRTVFRAPQAACIDNAMSLRLIRDNDAALAHIPTDRGMSALSNGFANTAIQHLMTFTIKAEYAYDYGMPQWVSRVDHVIAPLHPERLFLGRHKFYHYRVWYRDALATYVREMLLDSRTLSRSYLQRGTVEEIVRRHLKGDRNYTSEIHKILTLELIARLFVDVQ
jgi:asparagine synthase (glutamine-hydrolysing)